MRSNFWPIFRREYVTRITTKGFWISTALLPLFVIIMSIIPLLTSKAKSSNEPITIVDVTGQFYPLLMETREGASPEDLRDVPEIRVEHLEQGTSLEALTHRLNEEAEQGGIQGYFVIDPESLATGELTFYARNPSSSAVAGANINSIMAKAVRRFRLMKLGFSGDQIDHAIGSVEFEIKKATNDPKKKEESGVSAFLTSFGLVMFIYFSLIFYGVHVLRGVLEEKSNRIVEVIVSTVKPFELMLGKILGIGAVGITQVTMWVVFAAVISMPQVTMALSLSKDQVPSLGGVQLIFFPIYFVLGFFLYATIYAGIGSMFNSEEDAQQMVSVATMMLVIPMFAMMPVMKNPGGPLALGLSLFPFFTPILMFLRIGVQMPPAWQIALSIGIMIGTILLLTWLVSKIYRVGILMYGKKPTLPELIRWLRYT